MLYIQGIIREKTLLTPNIFSLWVFAPEISHIARPGQFINLRVNRGYEPFLNRPFSIADVSSNYLCIVIKIVGRGTEMLYQKRIGDKLDILGPLGNPVKIPKGRKVLVVGGGVGIAPLYFLAKELKEMNDLSIIIGVKKKKELFFKKELLKLTKHLFIATEDGSAGQKGTAPALLNRLAKKKSFNIIYTCGPRAMLAVVKDLHLQTPVYAFMEDFLGCGCGICLGCAIRVNDEYRRICVDGPVFNLKKVRL